MEWNETLAVGVAELDGHHRQLIALIRNLFEAIVEERPGQVLDDVVADLRDYTMFHFTAEKRLMEAYHYPGLEAHHAQHQDFLGMVIQVSRHDTSDQEDAETEAREIMDYLSAWLVNHINGTDKKMAAYLKERGVR